jgi:hypothetical protein
MGYVCHALAAAAATAVFFSPGHISTTFAVASHFVAILGLFVDL